MLSLYLTLLAFSVISAFALIPEGAFRDQIGRSADAAD